MARVRNILTSLAKLFAASGQPIYVLDSQRQFIYCNPCCENWLQRSTEELVGLRCDYHSATQSDAASQVSAALCPPPIVFESQVRNAMTLVVKKDGSVSRRKTQFTPLCSDDARCLGVIAIVSGEEESSAFVNEAQLLGESPEDLHIQIQEWRAAFLRRFQIDRFVGTSLAVTRLRQQMEFAIKANGRTLIFGPEGSGRQHVARTIHNAQNAAESTALLPIECNLLDPKQVRTTIESFLQQYRSRDHLGNHTLLLNNVDMLAPEAQNDLVTFTTQPHSALQILSTARHPLLELAEQGRFSRELASHLSTFVIELPTLASRSEDIAPLSQAILEEQNSLQARHLGGFTPDALRTLAIYSWPRHLAELTEVIQEACGRAKGILVDISDLPPHLQMAANATSHPRREDLPIEIDSFLADIEKELLRRALARAKGNKAKAAKLLGMNRARLLRRLSQLRIES